MTQPAIEIKDLDALLARMEAEPEVALIEIHRATDASFKSLLPDLKAYPAPPPNSRYRRTKTLGRTWSAAPFDFAYGSSGFEGTLKNSTPYGPYVQGDDQAPIHEGRWSTADEIAEKHEPQVQQYFDQAGERIAKKIEGAG